MLKKFNSHRRHQEQQDWEHDQNKNRGVRRWVVEVAHSWFNRFRKLLVRYEKLERSFIGLNQMVS